MVKEGQIERLRWALLTDGRGQGQRRSVKQLGKLTSGLTGRQVQEAVAELRMRGCPVLGTAKTGYWLCEGPATARAVRDAALPGLVETLCACLALEAKYPEIGPILSGTVRVVGQRVIPGGEGGEDGGSGDGDQRGDP